MLRIAAAFTWVEEPIRPLFRQTNMKKIAGLVLGAMVIAACTAPSSDGPPRAAPSSDGPPRAAPSPTSQVAGQEQQTIDIYAAVIRRLVTKDHTFGGAPSPFEHIYVVDGAVEDAADPMKGDGRPIGPFAEDIKRGLEKKLRGLPPIDFISNPDSVRLGKNGLIKNHGVMVTLGPIEGDGDKVEVGNSLWCGARCGQWLTYVVKVKGGRWEVTGTTGPYPIS